MENKVDTLFIYKITFPYITEKKKLSLITYNKAIQNNFGIFLINYKIMSNKYIIIDKNGKGKEYNIDNDLIFEGEYLNRKRNGKGKEYNFEGELIYEGEYLNDKRNGKGKEFDDGKLIFEGEYLNGERNGRGKKYNDNF